MANTPINSPQQQSRSDFENDASGVKRTLKSEADEASSAFEDAREAVSSKASQFASEAKEGVMREAEGAKRQASESLRTFANTIREAGDKLSESDQGMAAGFVRQAASGLERLSSSLSEKRFGEMIEDVRSFGRRNPTAFIAGSVLAGLAIGRFVRSSRSADGNGHDGYGMGSPGGMASGRSRSAGATNPSGISPARGSRIGGDVGATPASRPGSSMSGSSGSPLSGSSASAGSTSGSRSSGIADQTRGISGNNEGAGGSGRAK